MQCPENTAVVTPQVDEHDPGVKMEHEIISRVPLEDEHLEDMLEEINISDNEETPSQNEQKTSKDSLVTSSLEVSPLPDRKVEIPLFVPPQKNKVCLVLVLMAKHMNKLTCDGLLKNILNKACISCDIMKL